MRQSVSKNKVHTPKQISEGVWEYRGYRLKECSPWIMYRGYRLKECSPWIITGPIIGLGSGGYTLEETIKFLDEKINEITK